MIVVADTSPLNYLVRLGYVDVLHRLHDRVVIPEAVLHEMLADGAPPAVRMWAERIPAWVSVMAVEELEDFGLMRLDRGEREALALAVRTNAGLLLVDDLPARRAARQRGIKIAGTLGILKDAADAGLLDFRSAVTALRTLGFRMTDALVEEMLNEL